MELTGVADSAREGGGKLQKNRGGITCRGGVRVERLTRRRFHPAPTESCVRAVRLYERSRQEALKLGREQLSHECSLAP